MSHNSKLGHIHKQHLSAYSNFGIFKNFSTFLQTFFSIESAFDRTQIGKTALWREI
jgi:hypothetical protein